MHGGKPTGAKKPITKGKTALHVCGGCLFN